MIDFNLLVNYRDRLCGKLICKYERERLIDIPDTTIFYSNINGQICVSVEYSSSHMDNSKMWIKDGTVCGENKVCSLLFSNDFLIFIVCF